MVLMQSIHYACLPLVLVLLRLILKQHSGYLKSEALSLPKKFQQSTMVVIERHRTTGAAGTQYEPSNRVKIEERVIDSCGHVNIEPVY